MPSLATLSHKSVRQECLTRVSSMILSRYSTRMSRKNVQQVCPIRVPRKRFQECQKECQARMSHKGVSQECLARSVTRVLKRGFYQAVNIAGATMTFYDTWGLVGCRGGNPARRPTKRARNGQGVQKARTNKRAPGGEDQGQRVPNRKQTKPATQSADKHGRGLDKPNQPRSS